MLQNIPAQPLLIAGDMSTDLFSNGVYLGQLLCGSLQAIYTGSPTGALTVEVSNDNVAIATTGGANLAANVVNWTTLDDSSVTVSAAGSKLWNLQFMGYLWARVKWVKSSTPTGSLTIKFCGKG